MNQTGFGGDPNEPVLVQPIRTMSETDAGLPISRALGAERARRLMSRTASVHVQIMRCPTDLSYMLNQGAQKAASAR